MANSEFENVQYVSPKRPRRKFHKKWLLLLLIPVVIMAAGGLGYLYYINKPPVTAPGQLEIYAYNMDVYPHVEYEDCTLLRPGEELSEEYSFMTGMNSISCMPFSFSFIDPTCSDATIELLFSLTGGECCRFVRSSWSSKEENYLGQQFTLENEKTVNWRYAFPLPDQAYIDIKVCADGNTVGCATLMLYKVEKELWYEQLGTVLQPYYYPKLIGSVSFPKQNGFYQHVTEEDVQEYFAQWKQK